MADAPVFSDADASGGKSAAKSVQVPPGATVIIQQGGAAGWRSWALRLVLLALGVSILMNLGLIAANYQYLGLNEGPEERFYKGDLAAEDKIAVIDVSGTIMPPYTERWIKQIDKAGKDKHVKGVLLVVDSPGGLVADSHQMYHRLKKLSGELNKPIYVQMKRLAASGGYYISMGGGPQAKIYAEETTWTGSIGVIMPRYDVSQLADKVGVKSEPLTTGEFKDTLNPFKPMTESEKDLWKNILNQSYEKFTSIIDENRDTLDLEQVKKLATGQIFTAKDAQENGLIDAIGYEDDSLDALKQNLSLGSVRIVKYHSPLTLVDVILGNSKSNAGASWQAFLEASVPRAYYFCSWLPPLPE